MIEFILLANMIGKYILLYFLCEITQLKKNNNKIVQEIALLEKKIEVSKNNENEKI